MEVISVETIDFPLTEPSLIYILKNENRNIAIDAGAIDKPDIDINKINLLLITHWHWDHVMGLSHMNELTDKICMSKITYHILINNKFIDCFKNVISAGGLIDDKQANLIFNIFYNRYEKIKNNLKNMKISLLESSDCKKYLKNISIIRCPGHTIDHMCFIIDKYIFVGDVILPKTRPTVINSLDHRNSLIKLLGYQWETLYPGHGNPMHREDVREYVISLLNNRLKRLYNIISFISNEKETNVSDLMKAVYSMRPSIQGFVHLRTLVGYLTELESFNIIKIDKTIQPWRIRINTK